MGTFWQEVKAQTLAGGAVVLVTATVGGIGYLIYTVPRQLAQVLENQQEIKTDLEASRRDILENAKKIGEHDGRLIRLETISGVKR
jgi:hypothetical protein